MYDLDGYLRMMRDPVRMGSYAAAIRDGIRDGDVVLDIGAGLGVFGLLALQAGAARVYAVETSDVLDVAREVAGVVGVRDRLVFLQGDSCRLDLPERVDVVISDLHGALPLLGNGLQAIVDARRRFLKPGGR